MLVHVPVYLWCLSGECACDGHVYVMGNVFKRKICTLSYTSVGTYMSGGQTVISFNLD